MNKILNFHCNWMQWSFWGKQSGQYKISSIFWCINKAKSNCLSLAEINITGTSHKDHKLCSLWIITGGFRNKLFKTQHLQTIDWKFQNTALIKNWLYTSPFISEHLEDTVINRKSAVNIMKKSYPLCCGKHGRHISNTLLFSVSLEITHKSKM